MSRDPFRSIPYRVPIRFISDEEDPDEAMRRRKRRFQPEEPDPRTDTPRDRRRDFEPAEPLESAESPDALDSLERVVDSCDPLDASEPAGSEDAGLWNPEGAVEPVGLPPGEEDSDFLGADEGEGLSSFAGGVSDSDGTSGPEEEARAGASIVDATNPSAASKGGILGGAPKPPVVESGRTTAGEKTLGGAPKPPAGMNESVAASADVESLRGQLEQSLAREKRWLADLENYRRRTERMFEEQAELRKRALAGDLLEVVDDLDRALDHAAESETGLKQGVEAIRGKLLATLARHGLTPFNPLNQPFDPTTQEAVSTMRHPELEDNTVAAVLRAGWKAGNRLLRPAQVIVVKNQ